MASSETIRRYWLFITNIIVSRSQVHYDKERNSYKEVF